VADPSADPIDAPADAVDPSEDPDVTPAGTDADSDEPCDKPADGNDAPADLSDPDDSVAPPADPVDPPADPIIIIPILPGDPPANPGNPGNGGGKDPKNPPAQVQVPNLHGLSYAAAQQLLQSKGLTIHGIAAPKGLVLQQAPKAATLVPAGSQVKVYLYVKVPALHGKSYLNAKLTLQAKGLKINPAKALPGKVKSQMVKDQKWVPLGSAVGVKMQVKVPVLVGMSYAQAKQALKNVGLKINGTTMVLAQHGFVVSQSNKAPFDYAPPYATVYVQLKVKVPQLHEKNLTFAQAQTLLAQRGLKIQVGNMPATEKGFVGWQSVAANTLLEPGKSVTVKMGVTVPNLKQHSVADAKAQLHKEGLAVQVVGNKNVVSNQAAYGWVWLPCTVKLYAN
jgi:beta-lactam-binding protein with PASTA domain